MNIKSKDTMTNENIKIEEDFLKQEDINKIQELMLGDLDFPWYFKYRFYDNINLHTRPIYDLNIDLKEDELDKFSFVHTFYDSYSPLSPLMEHLDCILQLLQPASIMRIRANLITRLPNIVENPFHSDLTELSEEKQKQWMTSIFYVNTNDGYTVFEDGTKVESVANRILTFPANMKHTGTSCTNTQIRVLINFNYYKNAREYDQVQ